jgi:hypothetical protein
VASLLGSCGDPLAAQVEREDAGRELTAEEAVQILGIPRTYLDRLTLGGAQVKAEGAKDRLGREEFKEFVQQFSRRDGVPIMKVGPNEAFVLVPLSKALEKAAAAAPPGPNDQNPAKVSKTWPNRIDHLESQTPVRNQEDRGTCVAFAACGELEAILRRVEPNYLSDLSPNLAYYWFMLEENSKPSEDTSLATWRAADYLKKHLVGAERFWPYVGTDPYELRTKDQREKIDTAPLTFCGENGAGIDDYLLLPHGNEVLANGTIDIRDTRTLERLLSEGHDIVFGTAVAWKNSDATGLIDVKLGPGGQPILGNGGHAMMIVGYMSQGDDNDTTPYFTVKNSWGKKYGHKGYLHISYDYIRTYARYGYTTLKLKKGRI